MGGVPKTCIGCAEIRCIGSAPAFILITVNRMDHQTRASNGHAVYGYPRCPEMIRKSSKGLGGLHRQVFALKRYVFCRFIQAALLFADRSGYYVIRYTLTISV